MPVTTQDIVEAQERLQKIIKPTPVELNENYSDLYKADIFFKREDLQIVRSYKIRGAYNNIASRNTDHLQNGIVCASAGNHAQGFALSCRLLNIQGHIFMPSTTPKQKVNQVKMFGKDKVEVILQGDTFDDSYAKAIEFCEIKDKIFIHPFDNAYTIAGQGTVAKEILDQIHEPIDYLFVPIGGGGLAAGMSVYFKSISPKTKIIGVEPLGAPSMKESIDAKQVVTLEQIDKFIDGAAVKRVGDITFGICQKNLDDVVLVPEGKVCTTILKLYNEEAIVVEPAGALSIAALDFYKDEIKGKRVVCVVSGSNNDIDRMNEIKERSLIYEGIKKYLIVTFPQRPGALRQFVDSVLGPSDDITRFEYLKKTNKEHGAAIVGLEFKHKDDFEPLTHRLSQFGFKFLLLNDLPTLYDYLV